MQTLTRRDFLKMSAAGVATLLMPSTLRFTTTPVATLRVAPPYEDIGFKLEGVWYQVTDCQEYASNVEGERAWIVEFNPVFPNWTVVEKAMEVAPVIVRRQFKDAPNNVRLETQSITFLPYTWGAGIDVWLPPQGERRPRGRL